MEDVYTALEEKFLTYAELAEKPVEDCGEALVPLSQTRIRFVSLDPRMAAYTGTEVYVRSGVVEKLEIAQGILSERKSGLQLEVFCGYRAQEIQKESFEKYRQELLSRLGGQSLSEEEVKDRTHRFIAVPEVAGHPTGGAVDVRLVDSAGNVLDMGTPARAFVRESYALSPFVTRDVWQLRQLLRECMIKAGFAPFDGEWWHFSYGDREWAAYLGKRSAIYTQIDFRA